MEKAGDSRRWEDVNRKEDIITSSVIALNGFPGNIAAII
jgi:hypothetical protein